MRNLVKNNCNTGNDSTCKATSVHETNTCPNCQMAIRLEHYYSYLLDPNFIKKINSNLLEFILLYLKSEENEFASIDDRTDVAFILQFIADYLLETHNQLILKEE